MNNLKKASRPLLSAMLLGAGAGLLSACGGSVTNGGTVTPPTPSQPSVIAGQLQPWSNQGDAVEHQLTGLSAAVSSSGTFDLGLPNSATMNSTYSGDLNSGDNTFGLCTGGNINTPATFKSLVITTLNLQKGGQVVAEYVGGSVTTFNGWWYANMDATISANTSCIGFGNVNQSLSLKKGWNAVQFRYDGTATTITLISTPTGRVTFSPTKTASQSLNNPYLFNPWAALHH